MSKEKNKNVDGYKVPKKIEKVYFKSVVKKWEWNKNTANFEQVEKDIQKDIDTFKSCDLKEMINKNIIPNTENKGIYTDTTIFKDVNMYNFNDALNSDLIIENDEKDEKVINKNNDEVKDSNPQDSNSNV